MSGAENPTPRYSWKDADVHSVIDTRSELNDIFTGKKGMGAHGWNLVAANLRCGASSYQCEKKSENLQKSYKEIINPPTGAGLEEAGHPADTWPFFNKMNQFMSSRHTINPPLVIQSASLKSSIPKSSGLKNHTVSKKPDDDHVASLTSDEEEPCQQPAKRRRVAAATPKDDSVPGLMAMWRADMKARAEDREKSQNTDNEFLDVFRKYMLKRK